VLPAEDIQWQITIVPIISAKKSPFLTSVHRIARGIHVEDDLWRRLVIALRKTSTSIRSIAA
jgi:hypothetical protein